MIGVALGFGAQSLVKDYLSGNLPHSRGPIRGWRRRRPWARRGTVEDVTLRITRLRDMSGVVWYVRNGEVLRVANRSQGLDTGNRRRSRVVRRRS